MVVLPDGKDFEAYIANDESKDALIEVIIVHEAKSPQHADALMGKWAGKSAPAQLAAIVETLQANKTQYGARLGKALAVPGALAGLFGKIDAELAPPGAAK